MLHVFNSQFWPLKWDKTTVFWLITTKHSLSVNELSFSFSDTCLKDYTFAFSWLILSLIWLSLSFNVSHHYQLELLSSFLTLVDNIKQKRSFTHYNIRMVNLWSFSQLLIANVWSHGYPTACLSQKVFTFLLIWNILILKIHREKNGHPMISFQIKWIVAK